MADFNRIEADTQHSVSASRASWLWRVCCDQGRDYNNVKFRRVTAASVDYPNR